MTHVWCQNFHVYSVEITNVYGICRMRKFFMSILRMASKIIVNIRDMIGVRNFYVYRVQICSLYGICRVWEIWISILRMASKIIRDMFGVRISMYTEFKFPICTEYVECGNFQYVGMCRRGNSQDVGICRVRKFSKSTLRMSSKTIVNIVMMKAPMDWKGISSNTHLINTRRYTRIDKHKHIFISKPLFIIYRSLSITYRSLSITCTRGQINAAIYS